MYTLSEQDIENFSRDGFLVVPLTKHGVFDALTIHNWTYEIKEWPKTKGKWMIYEEVNRKGERQIMKTECFSDYHQALGNLLREGQLPQMLQQLSGSKMVLFKDKINYKAPNGNGFLAHLDGPSYDRIAKVEHLTINIAVDPATLKNGCLEVVPGSHKMNVALTGTGPLINPEWEGQQTWLPVPLDPGDLLIFGSHVAHRSKLNESNQSRASIYATYNSILDGNDFYHPYYANRRAVFPPEYERVDGVDYKNGYEMFASASPEAGQRNPGKRPDLPTEANARKTMLTS